MTTFARALSGSRMMKYRIFLASMCCVLLHGVSAVAFAEEESAAALRQKVETCMKTPGTAVSYKIITVANKPVSEKATPEEDAEVRKILEAGGRKYDPVRHRASYLFVLGALRTKQVMRFTIESDDGAGDMEATRACLAELAKSKGMGFEIN